jgi:PleD family two-component response regulator
MDDLAAPLARLLIKSGLAAMSLPCGERLIAYLHSAVTPVLVILDLDMPEMNGLQCLEAMKGSPVWREIPVIIYSSEISSQKRDEAQQLGAQDCIIKGAMKWPDLLAVFKLHATALT